MIRRCLTVLGLSYGTGAVNGIIFEIFGDESAFLQRDDLTNRLTPVEDGKALPSADSAKNLGEFASQGLGVDDLVHDRMVLEFNLSLTCRLRAFNENV